MNRTAILATSVTALLVASPALSVAAPSPQDFIKDAIQGDNSEIMLGQLAQQKGGSDKVKSFGQMLVDDHTKAKQEASDVAGKLGVQPPTDPTQEAKDENTKLSKMSGADFDKEFAAYMVKDHLKDIAEFQDEAKADQGPAGQLAGKTVPTLQKHLQVAQSLTASDNSTNAPPVSGFLDKEGPELWRGSKLDGVAIYGPDNKKVGGITDVLMDHEGKATYVVIGVGGFLGIGQKDVAIPFAQVKFTDEPVNPPAAAPAPATQGTSGGMAPGGTTTLGTPAGTVAPAGAPAAPGAAMPANTAPAADRTTTYPDHGMISLTADQLKAAPTFEFAK
ncbi:MAG TPA: DUF4142 domain-containing protein [Lichenihabitans sp.]|jgi:putative membrane protein|nr:DUF4142 domain-containing protein [Lichenihabitans sp.]